MRDQSATVADRPSTVVCNHPDDVAEVHAQPGHKLHVRFFDGTSGIVDLSDLIASPNAGVFAALRDEALFANVGIVFGAVTWPNGLDLAPDAMHDALSRSSEWHLAAQIRQMQLIQLETKIAAPPERCFLLSLNIDLHKASTGKPASNPLPEPRAASSVLTKLSFGKHAISRSYSHTKR